jgi:HEAT repeat protein
VAWSPADRIAALVAEIGPDEVVAWCADLLAGRVGPAAAERPPLTWLGGRHAVALLDREQVVDPTHAYWVRVWAARGLLHAYAPAAGRDVVAALADEAWRVRELAAKVVARWEVGEASDAVALLVTDDVPRVRAAAVRAIGVVGEAEHAAGVRGALDDAEPAVRRAADTALHRLRVRLDRDL